MAARAPSAPRPAPLAATRRLARGRPGPEICRGAAACASSILHGDLAAPPAAAPVPLGGGGPWPRVVTRARLYRAKAPSATVLQPPASKEGGAAYPGAFADGALSAADGGLPSAEATGGGGGGGGGPWRSDLIFVGSGTSEGIPRVSCLTDPRSTCQVCRKATIPGNPNRRRNTSLLLRHVAPDGAVRNILFDVGKFFYHSALQWFPFYGVRRLDAVVVTHSHADAIGGLDDLRDWTNNVQDVVPIYVAQRDLEVMAKTHYYLLDTSGLTAGTAVSKLHFRTISAAAPFSVCGLEVTPLPVWHGKDYLSLGFRFGDTCYISDASEIPDTTYPLLRGCDLLILDALRPGKSSSTHFGLPAALEEVRKIRPKRTLLTGMMHLMDHNEVNARLAPLLASEGLDVSLSYDGQRVPVDL